MRLALLAGAATAAIALATGCSAHTTPSPAAAPLRTAASTPAATPASTPDATPKPPVVAWAELDAATFARAKKERRFVVLDGAAEWCHWCHVMDATTYHDPEVAKLLAEKFIAVKVDVDARPDVEERYGEWGWPATVVFSPDGEELGKYRGYLAPEDFLEILRGVVAGRAGAQSAADDEARRVRTVPPGARVSDETLAWMRRITELELEEYWDPKEGGWGRSPKVPIGGDAMFALARAKAGDAKLREHALVVLDKQRAIVDPVWGGIYQYSVAPDWVHPHYEKLITFNAGALESYATAYALTHDPQWLDAARSIDRYLRRFLLTPDGGFHGTQDADLNAHELGKRFMAGERYYALGDAERRALGTPRVDEHEYARDAGLAIEAYVTLYEQTGDAEALALAKRAAARALAVHMTKRGGVSHDAVAVGSEQEPKVLHLADNAQLGYALARLAAVTKDRPTLDAAASIATFVTRELVDARTGAFMAHTEDRDAVGVFSTRRHPFDDNVTALRFLLALGRAEDRPVFERALASIATPDAMKAQGRFLGTFLLLLDETAARR